MAARAGDIKRALGHFGATLETGSSGSHWKIKKPGCRAYTLPCSNGERTEISDRYIRAMCRQLGIDEADFKALL